MSETIEIHGKLNGVWKKKKASEFILWHYKQIRLVPLNNEVPNEIKITIDKTRNSPKDVKKMIENCYGYLQRPRPKVIQFRCFAPNGSSVKFKGTITIKMKK